MAGWVGEASVSSRFLNELFFEDWGDYQRCRVRRMSRPIVDGVKEVAAEGQIGVAGRAYIVLWL